MFGSGLPNMCILTTMMLIILFFTISDIAITKVTFLEHPWLRKPQKTCWWYDLPFKIFQIWSDMRRCWQWPPSGIRGAIVWHIQNMLRTWLWDWWDSYKTDKISSCQRCQHISSLILFWSHWCWSFAQRSHRCSWKCCLGGHTWDENIQKVSNELGSLVHVRPNKVLAVSYS